MLACYGKRDGLAARDALLRLHLVENGLGKLMGGSVAAHVAGADLAVWG